MIFKCQVCETIKWLEKYTIVEYTSYDNLKHTRHKMKICKECGDVLENLKKYEEDLLNGKHL